LPKRSSITVTMSFFFARSNRCLHWQAPRALEDPSFSKLSEHERRLTHLVEFAPTPAAPGTRSRTAADCAKMSLAVMPIFFSQERADPLALFSVQTHLHAALHFTCRRCARSPPSVLFVAAPSIARPHRQHHIQAYPGPLAAYTYSSSCAALTHQSQTAQDCVDALSQDTSRDLSARVF